MDLAWPCMDNLEEKLIGGSMISTQERQRCSSSLSHFSFDYKTVAPEVLGVQHFSPAYLSTSVQFSSATQSCPTLCNPMNCSTPGLPVHQQLPEFTQTYVHRVGDGIQPSHPLLSPFTPAPNPSQHHSHFQ